MLRVLCGTLAMLIKLIAVMEGIVSLGDSLDDLGLIEVVDIRLDASWSVVA